MPCFLNEKVLTVHNILLGVDDDDDELEFNDESTLLGH